MVKKPNSHAFSHCLCCPLCRHLCSCVNPFSHCLHCPLRRLHWTCWLSGAKYVLGALEVSTPENMKNDLKKFDGLTDPDPHILHQIYATAGCLCWRWRFWTVSENTKSWYHTKPYSNVTGRSGLACLTAVRDVLGSNRAVGSCVYRTTTVIYSFGHELCAPFLQCLGQLSLLPYVGR